jgi:hypothetical protein
VTYTELQAAIINYTQNSESVFVANIPLFVKQTEERVYNTVQIPALRKNVTGTTTQNNRYLSCPIDFLSSFSMSVLNQTTGEFNFLLNKDVNFIRSSFPDPLDTGFPQYYALYGPTVVGDIITTELSFIIGPTPDNGYSVELNYYYYPESIVDAGTSWLGDNYDPVLLYGSLYEAYVFMKGEQDMMAYYKEKYEGALGQLNRLGTGLERGDAYRDGQAKIKVNP